MNFEEWWVMNIETDECPVKASEKTWRYLGQEVESLEKKLTRCKAALKYAYEDTEDQYYLNVLKELE